MSTSIPENPQANRGRRFFPASLQTRLVLFVLSIALVPLIIIAVRDILQTQQALTNSAQDSLLSSAEQTAVGLDTFISTTLHSIGIESEFSDFVSYLSLAETDRRGSADEVRAADLLNKLRSKDSENIISYALVDPNGIVLLDTNKKNIQKNESNESYFPLVRFSDQPIATPVTFLDERTTIITFASKVLNANGDYLGVLRIKYSSDILQSLVTRSAGGDPNTLVLLLDDINIRLADNRNPSLILKSITPLNLVDYLNAVSSKRMLNLPREQQATNFIDFRNKLDNAKTQPFFRVDITPNVPGDDSIAVAYMKTRPWTVAFSRPSPIFLADVQKQTNTNTILVISISVLITLITTLVARSLTNPILSLTRTANSISQGDLSARSNVKTSDEIGLLASAFNSMTSQLQTTLAGLEERIFNRTQDLQKSNLELETIAEVAREISIIRDLDTLLNVSASLIRERLNYYHVGIFLVDERNEFAHLQAANSIASEQMLSQKIKFPINGSGDLAVAMRTGQVYFSPEISKDKNISKNPLLPDTVSEAFLPLRIRNLTIGVLDIQARDKTALGERETNTLKLLADQLAAAVENAKLVKQVDETLVELTNANRSQSQEIWRGAIGQRDNTGYEYNGLQIKPIPQNLPADLLRQLENGKAIITNRTNNEGVTHNTLVIPLVIFNQTIGVIGIEKEDPDHEWTETDISIAQAAANRAALTLENVRLLEESQRRATKERAISNATSRIGSAVNMENILQATAEELEHILGDAEIILQFQLDNETTHE